MLLIKNKNGFTLYTIRKSSSSAILILEYSNCFTSTSRLTYNSDKCPINCNFSYIHLTASVFVKLSWSKITGSVVMFAPTSSIHLFIDTLHLIKLVYALYANASSAYFILCKNIKGRILSVWFLIYIFKRSQIGM